LATNSSRAARMMRSRVSLACFCRRLELNRKGVQVGR
jgi:hypothetical protein